jgi:hypothetical protein
MGVAANRIMPIEATQCFKRKYNTADHPYAFTKYEAMSFHSQLVRIKLIFA